MENVSWQCCLLTWCGDEVLGKEYNFFAFCFHQTLILIKVKWGGKQKKILRPICDPWWEKSTRVGSLSLLQGIFPTQGSNPGLPHCRWILYHLSHQKSPGILEWVSCPFSRRFSWPRNWTSVSCTASRFFTSWATRKALCMWRCKSLGSLKLFLWYSPSLSRASILSFFILKSPQGTLDGGSSSWWLYSCNILGLLKWQETFFVHNPVLQKRELM